MEAGRTQALETHKPAFDPALPLSCVTLENFTLSDLGVLMCEMAITSAMIYVLKRHCED